MYSTGTGPTAYESICGDITLNYYAKYSFTLLVQGPQFMKVLVEILP